jgi:hypothetical protein
MTGDDSYHAHCFKCKVCTKRIDELVFAKTSQGIYCMDCHNERMIKIRKHAQKKAERERAGGGSGSSRSREQQARNFHRDQDVRLFYLVCAFSTYSLSGRSWLRTHRRVPQSCGLIPTWRPLLALIVHERPTTARPRNPSTVPTSATHLRKTRPLIHHPQQLALSLLPNLHAHLPSLSPRPNQNLHQHPLTSINWVNTRHSLTHPRNRTRYLSPPSQYHWTTNVGAVLMTAYTPYPGQILRARNLTMRPRFRDSALPQSATNVAPSTRGWHSHP